MPPDFLTLCSRAGSEVVPYQETSSGPVTEAEMARGSLTPSLSDFKPRVSEAEDMVVLLLSETIWIAHDTKSHILEQRTWPCLVSFGD